MNKIQKIIIEKLELKSLHKAPLPLIYIMVVKNMKENQ
jgi:hypothetical protein